METLRIHRADNVAVALQPLRAGERIDVGDRHMLLKTDIPAGHKVALQPIAAGQDVIKYGCPIGHATCAIEAGALVDHHNLKTNLERQYVSPDSPPALPVREGAVTFAGCNPSPSLIHSAPSLARLEETLDPSRTGRAGGESSPTQSNAFRSLPNREGGGRVLGQGGELGGPWESTFPAYVRPDGQVGIRNDVWVIPTVGCVNTTCRQIAERATRETGQRVCCFPHNYGCSQLGEDHEQTRLILRDMALHPNAGGVLIVGLGCENNQPRDFERLLGDYDRRRIRFLVAQEVEGDEVEAGLQIVRELCRQAQGQQRVAVPWSMLRVGLKCGGSDGFSGLTANALLGVFSDWLCGQGGTTILTEVPEMFGAEHMLRQRAATDEVRQQLDRMIADFKRYYRSHGQPVGENPSPGNHAGGISTLEEKALGCTQKSGSSPVCGILAYGDRLPAPGTRAEGAATSGLHLLSAPGNDLVASTALAAAGCQLVLFTTGRGTPFSTFVPTLKVSSNTELARRKPEWIDFDAGGLLSEGTTLADLLPRFISRIAAILAGQPTCAERRGTPDFAIFKTGVTL